MARSQSEVMGVVLLVAVTIFTGTVIVVFMSGFTDSVSETPTASSEIVQNQGAGNYETVAQLSIRHTHGQTIPVDELRVEIDGTPVSERDALSLETNGEGWDAGNPITVKQSAVNGLLGGETVNVIYIDPESRQTGLLVSHTVNFGGDVESDIFTFDAYQVDDEPGDPWEINVDPGPNEDAEAEVTDEYASVGENSLFLSSESGTCGETGCGTSSVEATVELDVSEVEELRVDYFDADEGVAVKIDDKDYDSFKYKEETWRTESIDISGMAGEATLALFIGGGEQNANSVNTVHFDNIRIFDGDGNEISPEVVLVDE